jgi:hypothetical protein
MYKHDVVDIDMLKYIMHEICSICPDLKSCHKVGDFKCLAAKDSILGMKSEGRALIGKKAQRVTACPEADSCKGAGNVDYCFDKMPGYIWHRSCYASIK